MAINAPKGTKDILPSQAYRWRYVERKFAELCERAGFSEIRTPEFEHTELFARGVGDTSDIVEKQMYTFSDYAGRSITLRPEGTAGVVRSFIEHKLYAGTMPAKLRYEISCFRYEKPQSGRLRAFHQFGVEIFGADGMIADTEVIALADDFLRGLGLTDLELRINSIGCPDCRGGYREALKAFLAPKYDELCETCKSRYERNPMRVLDCKSPHCHALTEGAPLMIDYLCDGCKEAFDDLQANLTALGIAYIVDPSIVRGLDYYTKTAFEFVTEHIGAQGTVCGGGRYDHLIEELGGPPIPGVGFGLGIERLLLLLENCGIDLPNPDGPDALVAFIGAEAKGGALQLLRSLREAGLSAEIDSLGRSIKNQFKYADRIGARHVVIIGDEELQSGQATVKDMNTGTQERVAFEKVAERINRNKQENE
ncbi:MAG: histidine--tRNA ligase [Clostridiales Family XIII bacterium]|jgi:histidyl-tRNA synthetase|nr:histidine--tRNA ligase [Clostridiales Family XIII bacterium]